MNQLLRKSLRCVCRSSHLNLRVAVLYANGAGIAVASDVHIHVPATILSSFLHGLFGYFLSHLLPTAQHEQQPAQSHEYDSQAQQRKTRNAYDPISAFRKPNHAPPPIRARTTPPCLLYTSDAADDLLCV